MAQKPQIFPKSEEILKMFREISGFPQYFPRILYYFGFFPKLWGKLPNFLRHLGTLKSQSPYFAEKLQNLCCSFLRTNSCQNFWEKPEDFGEFLHMWENFGGFRFIALKFSIAASPKHKISSEIGRLGFLGNFGVFVPCPQSFSLRLPQNLPITDKVSLKIRRSGSVSFRRKKTTTTINSM